MALVACRECNAAVSDQAIACPQCGARPAPAQPRPTGSSGLVMKALATAVAAFLLLSFVIDAPAPTAEQEAQTQAKRVIKACWKQQERKSLDPETVRLIAGTCEQLEAEYKSTYKTAP